MLDAAPQHVLHVFGVRGNRVFNVILGWGVGVAYEAINLSVGALAGFALVEQWGGSASAAVKWAVVLGTALVTFTIIASGPLSWGTGADYARYLPASTSTRAVTWWTALGGFLPSVVLGSLGVLAGTVVDMTDPQASLKTLLPGWFYPVFLLVIIVGSITNNVLTAYSSGLALQAMGIPWQRSVTVVFDAVIGVSICAYALFVSNFLDTLNNILELTVAFLGPALAIYAVDIWRGVRPAGAIAMVVGTAAALLCADNSLYVSPVSGALNGADLSAFVGPAVGACVYAVVVAWERRRSAAPTPAIRPVVSGVGAE